MHQIDGKSCVNFRPAPDLRGSSPPSQSRSRECRLPPASTRIETIRNWRRAVAPRAVPVPAPRGDRGHGRVQAEATKPPRRGWCRPFAHVSARQSHVKQGSGKLARRAHLDCRATISRTIAATRLGARPIWPLGARHERVLQVQQVDAVPIPPRRPRRPLARWGLGKEP